MKKTLMTLLLAGLLASSSAWTKIFSFTADIEIQDNTDALDVIQLDAIKFPLIVIDGSTEAGASCHTSWNVSGLCLGTTINSSNRHNGTYQVSGSVLAPVTLQLSGPVSANGFRFSPSFAASSYLYVQNKTLSSIGVATTSVYGMLELEDPAAITELTTSFTFDIIAVHD